MLPIQFEGISKWGLGVSRKPIKKDASVYLRSGGSGCVGVVIKKSVWGSLIQGLRRVGVAGACGMLLGNAVIRMVRVLPVLSCGWGT